jgi:hypothetical protein
MGTKLISAFDEIIGRNYLMLWDFGFRRNSHFVASKRSKSKPKSKSDINIKIEIEISANRKIEILKKFV